MKERKRVGKDREVKERKRVGKDKDRDVKEGKEESVNFEDILLVTRPSESTCFCHHFLPSFYFYFLLSNRLC